MCVFADGHVIAIQLMVQDTVDMCVTLAIVCYYVSLHCFTPSLLAHWVHPCQ